jgi:hypothetical protein
VQAPARSRQQYIDDCWTQAVAELGDRCFSSFEEVVEAVITAVLDRIHLDAQSQHEVRELLWFVFESDAEIESLLKSYLRIGR